MERERAQYLATAIGNALLVAAAVVFIVGAICIGVILQDTTGLFSGGIGDPGLADYIRQGTFVSIALVTATAILASAGLYFRWVAVEQDAKMAEFDMLLDALGVPVEDEAPPAENAEEGAARDE